MNITDLIQSYFSGDSAARLGQAVGVDAGLAQKALSVGLPMYLSALADHASQPEGQKQLLEAISSLPNFGSVTEVLSASDGASNLQRAGELLAPALLGGKFDSIVNAVTAQVGGSVGGVQKILQMSLPLVLSLLGRQGLNAGNIGSMMSGLRGLSMPDLGSVNVGNVNLNNMGGAAGLAAGAAALAGGAGGAPALLDFLKDQLSGANAEKIGAAAGFNANAAGRAVQGALPVVLNALVNKGKTEAGANDLLKMVGQFGGLTNHSGHLNESLLSDQAELARVEGQGRGLLGGLFGNVDEMAGRLGTALGGSGSNASRLLALLTPLVLSMLGKHTTGMNGSALSGLLGSLGENLSSLLPAGLGGLDALLGAGTATAAPVTERVVAAATPAAPVAPATPAPRPTTPPPPPSSTVSTTTTERRGGIPWWMWLIPLLLIALLFGLCNRKPADTATTTPPASQSTTTPASDGTFAITDPAANAELVAGGFELKGTGKAGDELEVFQDGTSLGKVTVGSDGTWSKNVPSPAAGAHTYSVKGPDGTELGNVATTVAAATGNAADCTKDYALTSITDGQTVTEPFLFGGEGKGKGYTVTVKRGDRTIGTKDLPLDGACGWNYQSKPGKGQITYEVRPIGDGGSAPLSTINLTVNQ